MKREDSRRTRCSLGYLLEAGIAGGSQSRLSPHCENEEWADIRPNIFISSSVVWRNLYPSFSYLSSQIPNFRTM